MDKQSSISQGKVNFLTKKMNGEKASSGETSTTSKNKLGPNVSGNWNVTPIRGKVTDRCFWTACKAMTAGVLFIIVGAGMATLGFYSDHLSKVEETKGNTTIWVKNESKDSHLASLTYLGPIVMGIGGFTIVAACVMTFEARDTASKIVPIWFKRTRIHVVSGGSGSATSSQTSWEKFLCQQRISEDAEENRTAVTRALVNFSKYLQTNVDTNKIPLQCSNIKSQQVIRKCPSEPNLVKSLRDNSVISDAVALLEVSTPQPSQRTMYGSGLKTITSKPLLSVAPDTYRQAVSMDCPRYTRHDETEKKNSVDPSADNTNRPFLEKNPKPTLPFQTSCTTSSSGSMSVDIYLPQGAVTLKIHDDMKEHKKSPLKPEDSDESQCTKLSQQSDFQSFDNDEVADIDDNVFINQETHFLAPQIILEPSDSKTCYFDNQENITENQSIKSEKDISVVENWASTYHSAIFQQESISDSLEVQSPSPCISTNFSFDCSETNSTKCSIDSVISNPMSSRFHGQSSLSQTDTSFYNVSSLGSSQDISSPLVFCESPMSFDHELVAKAPRKKVYSASEFTIKPEKTSPRKHSSLESASMPIDMSLERLSEDLLFPPLSIPERPFSPRKTRSESLPERRQAPSLKRFPLMRQGALDSFVEETNYRLDRSMTQIPKDP